MYRIHIHKKISDLKDIITLFIVTKMSSEKVKSKLDMRCLLRILNPEFFKYSDLIDSGLDTISKNVYVWLVHLSIAINLNQLQK